MKDKVHLIAVAASIIFIIATIIIGYMIENEPPKVESLEHIDYSIIRDAYVRKLIGEMKNNQLAGDAETDINGGISLLDKIQDMASGLLPATSTYVRTSIKYREEYKGYTWLFHFDSNDYYIKISLD